MTQLKIPTAEWQEPFFAPARYKGAYGGRGSSKSHGMAGMLIEEHIMHPDLKSVCIREVQKSLHQSVKALLEQKIEDFGAGHYFDVQQNMIKAKHGSGMIIFQGMQNHTADSIKSLEGFDRAWVEEAQSLSQRSLDLLRPTIRKEGSEIWFTWNPRHESDPVDLFLRNGDPPPNSVVKRVNWKDNPWFPQVLQDEMEYDRSRDPDKFAHVWEGEYESLSEARVFKNWKIEEFEAGKDTMFKFGADWGFAKDPTVLVRGYFEGRKLYVDYEAYEVGCEIDKTPDLFLTIPESEVFTIVADSARPETISYMQKHGFPNVKKALKGKNSIIEGINFLKTFDIIVHPRCKHLIDELTLYSYKVDPLTEEVMPILKDEHNHCIAEGELVRTLDGDKPIEDVTTDDMVLTRGGYQKVLFAGITDTNRDILEVVTTNGTVKCTPDHKIFTSNGFLRADALRYNDEIINLEAVSWSKFLSLTIKNIADTLSQKICQIGGITNEVLTTFIGSFGKNITEIYQRDITYITSMGTHQIIPSKTLSALTLKSIVLGTGMTIEEMSRGLGLIVLDTFQKTGTVVQKALLNIVRLAASPTKTLSLLRRGVNDVMKFFFLKNWETKTYSAQTTVNQHGVELQGKMTLTERVSFVIKYLKSINTQRVRLVPGRVVIVRELGQSKNVYDLTVQNNHEFIAGGVLVSNCIDALRYLAEASRRTHKAIKALDVKLIPSINKWNGRKYR